MLLKKNDDDPVAEKQKVRPEKALGRARLREAQAQRLGRGEGQAPVNCGLSEPAPFRSSHFTATYSHN